jgi:hypothetical protein
MKLLIAFFTLISLASVSCKRDKASTPVKSDCINTDIANAGRESALRAFEYDSCSQARDSALLEIRATQQKLVSEGMPNSAKSYAAGAQSVIDSLINR